MLLSLAAAVLFALPLTFGVSPAFAGTISIFPEGCYGLATGGAVRQHGNPPTFDPGDTIESTWVLFPDEAETTMLCRFDYPPLAPDPTLCTGAGEPFSCCAGNLDGPDCLAWTINMKRGSGSTITAAEAQWYIDVCVEPHGGILLVCPDTPPVDVEDFTVPAGKIEELTAPLAIPDDSVFASDGYRRTSAWLRVVRRNQGYASEDVVFRGATLCYPPSCPPSTPLPSPTPTPTP